LSAEAVDWLGVTERTFGRWRGRYDEASWPICSETWPGNATGVKALLPVVDRPRERIAIARMCVVADMFIVAKDARGRAIEFDCLMIR
jgi:hypothetical protein